MLEVGCWGWGSLRDLSKHILKQGVGKGKSVRRGFEGVTAPAPLPRKNFDHTPSIAIVGRASAD